MTGEDDVTILLRVELRPHAQAHLVGLPAEQFGIDRLHEGVHAVETGGLGARRQPFDITVRARDVAVGAGCDMDDDLSAIAHSGKGKSSSFPSGSSIWIESYPHQVSLLGTERSTSSRRSSASPSAVSSMNRRALSRRVASSQRMISHSP